MQAKINKKFLIFLIRKQLFFSIKFITFKILYIHIQYINLYFHLIKLLFINNLHIDNSSLMKN
jgi:hypothetical protein